MQIVIDIDEDMYKAVKDGMWCGNHTIGHALANGTPLPEEHGRLIDESKITKCYMPINQFDLRGIRTDAPTIIADTESEEQPCNMMYQT